MESFVVVWRINVPNYYREKKMLEEPVISDVEVWDTIRYLDPDLDARTSPQDRKTSNRGATIFALGAAMLMFCVIALVLHMRGL